MTRRSASDPESWESVHPGGIRVSLLPAPGAAAQAPIVVAPSADSGGYLVGGAAAAVSVRWLDADRVALVGPGRDGAADAGDRREADASPAERVLLLPPVAVARTGSVRREVIVGGWRIEVEIEAAARAALRERATRDRAASGHSGPTEVRAIIPGVVVSVAVTVGDLVVAGQQLLAIEAMKMQNELRAPRDGTVERIAVAPGRTIDVGELLLVIG